MPVKPQTSILAATVGLTAMLWLLGQISGWLDHTSLWNLLLTIGVGSAVFTAWWRRSPNHKNLTLQPSASTETVQQTLREVEQVLAQWYAEAGDSPAFRELQSRVTALKTHPAGESVQLLLVGGKLVGKTTLLQRLDTDWVSQHPCRCSVAEAPSLFEGGHPLMETAPLTSMTAADLVLFLVQGDLTQPEYEFIQALRAQRQRTVVVLNKQDQYLPAERSLLVQRLQQRLQSMIAPADIVAIAAYPKPVQVRQHQPDGTIKTWVENPAAQITDLTERLEQVLAQETEQLVLQTRLTQALALQQETIAGLNRCRRDRALPMIERYQWIAAGTAFASPVPALDLLASAAISGKMIQELAAIYQQPLSLEQAKIIATEMAKLMVQLGVIEFSTQTLGSLLKSHSLTFVAGGLIQAVSAAYLTRLAGLSLVEYYQVNPLGSLSDQTSWNLDTLALRLRQVFQQNQRVAFLQALCQEALPRLRQTIGFPASAESVALPIDASNP